MKWQKKLGVGAVLGILGVVGIALGPQFGFTALGRPWSFIAGFITGVVTGLGVTLAVAGLLERRAGK